MANITPFGLRMQPELKSRVEEAARSNTRSLNAEIVARLEASFEEGAKALLEAAQIAETLRKNLTDRIKTYNNALEASKEYEKYMMRQVQEAERLIADRDADIQKMVNERVKEIREDYEALMADAKKRWEEADKYAGFTIARERQFIETIKALTGKEPPAVEPDPTHVRR